MVADHHGHLDARARYPQLIENRLVRLDDVFELFGTAHERQLPEPKRVAHNEQFSFRTFLFQFLQKGDEIGGVVAMLQATVTAHVKVADKVILLRQSASSVLCGSNALASASGL